MTSEEMNSQQNIADFFIALARNVVFYDKYRQNYYAIKRVVLTSPSSQDTVYARIAKMHNTICDESYPTKCGDTYIVTYMKLIYLSFIPATHFYV